MAVGCWEEKVSASTRLYKEVEYEKVGRWWAIDKREPITGTKQVIGNVKQMREWWEALLHPCA